MWNNWVYNLWNDTISVELWQMFLVGLALLGINFTIFIALCFLRCSVAMETGYPKRNYKFMKKKMKSYSFIDRILLIKLTQGAEKKGTMLYCNFIFHCMNLLALVLTIIGYIGSLITLADGWALWLLVASEFIMLLLTLPIEFVLHSLFLPSERRRYRMRK